MYIPTHIHILTSPNGSSVESFLEMFTQKDLRGLAMDI